MGKVGCKLRLGSGDWPQPVLIVEGLLVPCFCVILVPSLKLPEGDMECSRSDENGTGETHAASFDAQPTLLECTCITVGIWGASKVLFNCPGVCYEVIKHVVVVSHLRYGGV